MNIVPATERHIEQVADLFDHYRQFYQCQPDRDLARAFIKERIGNSDSFIYLALDDKEQGLGFVQLYPSYCSVDAIKILILYDLYVHQSARGTGLGEQLMQQARQCAKYQGAKRIDLLTAKDNRIGQSLYQKMGYYRSNQDFDSYSLDL